MNLTLGQKVAMALIAIQAIAGGSAQLVPVFGQHVTTIMVSLASLAGTIFTGWIFVITGQGSLVKQVADMPGVQKIDVNKEANATLAALALDPKVDKVSAKPEDIQTVIATAKGV